MDDFSSYEALIMGECSGAIRTALGAAGINTLSCDLKPARDSSAHHYKGDWFVPLMAREWRFVMVHPVCTGLCGAGNRHYGLGKEKHWVRIGSAKYTQTLWRIVKRQADIAILENPRGSLPALTDMGQPHQTIQPYWFGEDMSKATCLWLHNIEPLEPTKMIAPKMINGKPRWGNQAPSGADNTPPGNDRSELRSNTRPGVASAIAVAVKSAIENR